MGSRTRIGFHKPLAISLRPSSNRPLESILALRFVENVLPSCTPQPKRKTLSKWNGCGTNSPAHITSIVYVVIRSKAFETKNNVLSSNKSAQSTQPFILNKTISVPHSYAE